MICPGSAAVDVAGIEAEMGRDGDAHVGHAHAGGLVAVDVEGGHRARVRRPEGTGRVPADAAIAVGAEIERGHDRQLGRVGQRERRDRRQLLQRVVAMDGGVVGPAGHGRRRRAHAVADPADEVHEGTAIQRRVVDHVERVRPSRAARTEIGQLGQPGGVLRGGVQVATHERRVVDVRPVDHVRVGKGGVTPPVLRRRVDEDQLRRFAVGGDPLEETVAAAGARVVLRGVGEGEPVPEARRRLHGRLRTTMVELAAAAAAHQAQRPVDGPPARTRRRRGRGTADAG